MPIKRVRRPVGAAIRQGTGVKRPNRAVTMAAAASSAAADRSPSLEAISDGAGEAGEDQGHQAGAVALMLAELEEAHHQGDHDGARRPGRSGRRRLWRPGRSGAVKKIMDYEPFMANWLDSRP